MLNRQSQDERLRELERSLSSCDELLSREYLALLLRSSDTDEGTDSLGEPFCVTGERVYGPLFQHETKRLEEVDPAALLCDQEGVGYVRFGNAAVYRALLRQRLLELEWITRTAPDRETTNEAFRVTLDLLAGAAIEKVAEAVKTPPPWAALRAAKILSSRDEPEAALVLARLTLSVPAEARARIYRSLAGGNGTLDHARPLLAEALAREKRELRPLAFVAFLRGATDRELLTLRREGPADVRALAFEALAQRATTRSRGNNRPLEFVREALADPAAELRRAAVRVLAGREWEKESRAQGWLMGRLIDADRTVRVEALRLLRRRELPARVAPRLRTIAKGAPPSLRPPIERLAERIER